MSSFSTYAVIMAGGRGRRLWPLSTPSRPKQFIEVDGKSLLARTFDRISPLIEPANVIVVTNKGKGNLVEEDLPELPKKNIIEEPLGKNTAPCIGLSAVYSREVLDLDENNSVMVVLPADHLVGREKRFRELLQMASDVAFNREKLVTLGIMPTRPATGYGYVEAGDVLAGTEVPREVVSFTEKPDSDTAEKFLDAGNYYWNSGTFIWRTDQLLNNLNEYMPGLSRGLESIAEALGGSRADKVLKEEYEKFSPVSIDYGLMEKAEERAVIPASVEWSDLGDWPSFEQLLESDDQGNSFQGEVICEKSKDNIVFNDTQKPVVALGLSDTVVVNTAEHLLVMNKDRAQEVKRLAQEMEEQEE
ncbi:NTP transferase domain-containing protein [Candidatus Bipolaricaulota bacterium]|nr:NTP transferase domain-containing protein [Candidatus Bipolaricaulota bacterium]